jgi:thymidylate kinase
MIKTKLILIEGIPCSGKSTTAIKIREILSSCGINCQCFLEWSPNNPIDIGRIENLSEIIATTKLRSQQITQNWKTLCRVCKSNNIINIMESRFWQTDAMYLYLSGHSTHDVIERSRRIVKIISEITPVLIYLAPQDIKKLLVEVTERKNKEWRKAGREGTWQEWGNEIYEQQSWFTRRSLKGEEAVIRFFSEWAKISDQLFTEVPFQKIKIIDPQVNWKNSMEKIEIFLGVNK